MSWNVHGMQVFHVAMESSCEIGYLTVRETSSI
jgi:hypothetical protein